MRLPLCLFLSFFGGLWCKPIPVLYQATAVSTSNYVPVISLHDQKEHPSTHSRLHLEAIGDEGLEIQQAAANGVLEFTRTAKQRDPGGPAVQEPRQANGEVRGCEKKKNGIG